MSHSAGEAICSFVHLQKQGICSPIHSLFVLFDLLDEQCMWTRRDLAGLCSGDRATLEQHLRALIFQQCWGQPSTCPASRQLPTFPVPSWIFFNMQIYEAGMKRGRLESRIGVIAEKNEQSVLQACLHFRSIFLVSSLVMLTYGPHLLCGLLFTQSDQSL